VIFLFTDFGSVDIYVGQVKAVLAIAAPGVPVVDLLNDAPRFAIQESAHLLAALAGQLPRGSVTLAVVDPGVGTARRPVTLRCDDRWFVGPDNGLLSVLCARRSGCEVAEILWRPATLSRSFHGRDLFAPIAGRIAGGGLDVRDYAPRPALEVQLEHDDLRQIIYLDSYGNAITGIRSDAIDQSAVLTLRDERIRHAGVFAEAVDDRPFWYVNSIGLVEIACNRSSAVKRCAIRMGDPVAVARD
jgi:S-adenosylmethionine hydrolase